MTNQPPPLPQWSRWIRFERVDPEKDLYREYGIAIDQNLFGEWVVSSSWGRIGGPKRVKEAYFTSKSCGENAGKIIHVEVVATEGAPTAVVHRCRCR